MGILRDVPGNDICADCGQPDPLWLSLNLGVVVCDECCSVHRSLSAIVSQMCCIPYYKWPKSQLDLMLVLGNTYANSVWEASAVPGLKPTPSHPVSPFKQEFITNKYKRTLFSPQDARPLPPTTLFYSVMGSDVRSTFLCLCMGFDPNMEDRSWRTPLHYAALAGSTLLVELLLIHGADPTLADGNGDTPADIARQNGYLELAIRLNHSERELFNRLDQYRADHRHLVSKTDFDAGKQLHAMTDLEFSNICIDIHDEVNRRIVNESWERIVPKSKNSKALPVPFLPLTELLSHTRQQPRQKLAVLTEIQLVTLVDRVLKEAYLRETGEQELEPVLVSTTVAPSSSSSSSTTSAADRASLSIESLIQRLSKEVSSLKESQQRVEKQIKTLQQQQTASMMVSTGGSKTFEQYQNQTIDELLSVSESLFVVSQAEEVAMFNVVLKSYESVLNTLVAIVSSPTGRFQNTLALIKETIADIHSVAESPQACREAASEIKSLSAALVNSLDVLL